MKIIKHIGYKLPSELADLENELLCNLVCLTRDRRFKPPYINTNLGVKNTRLRYRGFQRNKNEAIAVEEKALIRCQHKQKFDTMLLSLFWSAKFF